MLSFNMAIEKYGFILFILSIQHVIASDLIHGGIKSFEKYTSQFHSGEEEETARIIGGQNATDGQFPYAAALLYDDTFLCTASVISSTVILTAAHCVYVDGEPLSESQFSGVLGTADRTSENRTVVRFSEILVHEEYEEESLKNDIALLRLAEPLVFTDNIKPVCIARSETEQDEYKKATIMGWGRNNRFTRSVPNILQYAPVKLLPHKKCELRYPGQVTDNMICADGFGKGICHGDSGGPMTSESEGKEVQVGIASFVRIFPGCGSFIISPGVLTRVSAYADWIVMNVGDEICTA